MGVWCGIRDLLFTSVNVVLSCGISGLGVEYGPCASCHVASVGLGWSMGLVLSAHFRAPSGPLFSVHHPSPILQHL